MNKVAVTVEVTVPPHALELPTGPRSIAILELLLHLLA